MTLTRPGACRVPSTEAGALLIHSTTKRKAVELSSSVGERTARQLARGESIPATLSHVVFHTPDLKKTVAKYVNEFLQPVREHFEKDEKARKLKEQVEAFKVTR